MGFARISFIYKLYRLGARMEPCSTPDFISRGVGISPSIETLRILCERNELVSLMMLAERHNSESLYNTIVCQVVSKAFSMSENTAAVDMLLLK
jgi:hypothetical protein